MNLLDKHREVYSAEWSRRFGLPIRFIKPGGEIIDTNVAGGPLLTTIANDVSYSIDPITGWDVLSENAVIAVNRYDFADLGDGIYDIPAVEWKAELRFNSKGPLGIYIIQDGGVRPDNHLDAQINIVLSKFEASLVTSDVEAENVNIKGMEWFHGEK